MSVVFPEALQGEANYAEPTPDTTADPWRDEAEEADLPAVEANAAAPGPVDPTLPPSAIVAQFARGMLRDYYSRIFVIPTTVEVQNLVLGEPYAFELWNAFLEPNTLDTINATGATGVTPSAQTGEPFRRLEIKSFSITVDGSAPLEIEATFEFLFALGSGTLTFIGKRALIVRNRPEFPTVQSYEWQTDLLRTYDGTEQRISVRPVPRHRLEYEVILPSELEIRRMRAQLFQSLGTPILVPLWHEPFFLTADLPQGNTAILGDFSLADLAPGDFVYLETRDEQSADVGEVLTVAAGQIDLKTGLGFTFPAGSLLYPTAQIQLPDGQGFARFPVNAARLSLRGDDTLVRTLGGEGASVPTYQGLPLLDRRPLNDDPTEEGFRINYERLDFGNVFQVDVDQRFPTIQQPRVFAIKTRAELQFWKLFLDTVVGRREPFYFPTYRPDLVVVQQPVVGGSDFQVDTADNPDFARVWLASQGHQDLVLANADGDRLYRRVINTTDNEDGTLTVFLDSALPGTAGGSTLVQVEFLELARLGSDRVTFRHLGIESTLELVIEAVEG